jgi:hypothetical protein
VQVVLTLATGGELVEGGGQLRIAGQPFLELVGQLLLRSGWQRRAGLLERDGFRHVRGHHIGAMFDVLDGAEGHPLRGVRVRALILQDPRRILEQDPLKNIRAR